MNLIELKKQIGVTTMFHNYGIYSEIIQSLSRVQNSQDSGHSWGNAIKHLNQV
jgi:hypothetical protein